MKILILGLGSIGSYLTFITKRIIKKNKNKEIYLDLLTYNKRENNIYLLNIFDKIRKIDEIKIELNYDLKNEIFDIVIITCKSYDLTKYIDSLVSRNIKFKNLVLAQNGVEHEEEIMLYLKERWGIYFQNIYPLTVLVALKLKDNNLYIYNYEKNELVISSYNIGKFSNEILEFISLLNSITNINLYYGNYNDVKYSKLLLNLIMNVIPAYYNKDIKETYKNLKAVIDEKNLIIEFSKLMEKFNLKLHNFKYYNTKLIVFLYKILPSFIIYYIYNQNYIISKIRNNRIPSLIEDYVINPKTQTEIEYYLGNIIKKTQKINLDLDQFPTILKIYEKLKSKELQKR